MASERSQDERVADQVAQLLKLQRRSYVASLLCGLASRRHEPIHGEGWEGVPVELLDPPDGGDPIPVVRGELLVPPEEGRNRNLREVLGRYGLTAPDEDSERVVRFVRSREDGWPDLVGALRECDERGWRCTPNHVAALSGRMKGQSTPEYADSPETVVPTVETDPSGALVVVIDTGLAEEATHRQDRWLDGVVAVQEPRDIDLLDVVNALGQPGADGFLDRGAGHGTAVAGVARRVDPTADIRILGTLDTEGVAGEYDIGQAIREAATIFEGNDGRGVLNLSLGMETSDGLAPLAIESALEALPPDVMVVAAAGNSGATTPIWPAASKRVIAVGALTRDLKPTTWSSRGHWLDFATVGEGVISTFVTGTETKGAGDPHDPGDEDPETFPREGQTDCYALCTGTSFAAPQVAAWLARELATDPGLKPEEAKEALRKLGAPMKGFGYAINQSLFQ